MRERDYSPEIMEECKATPAGPFMITDEEEMPELCSYPMIPRIDST